MRTVASDILGYKRDRLTGAVAASLGLVASLLMNFNMEVAMSTSISFVAHLSIMAICLAMGSGWLGSLASPQARRVWLIHDSCPNQEYPEREVQFLPSPQF